MSKFTVEVVPLDLEPHPNATALSVLRHKGYTLVCKTADFEGSALAAFVPVDAVVPDTEEWRFVGSDRRVKPAKLRGVVSMGVLKPGKDFPHWKAGDDVAAELGITKWEPPPMPEAGGQDLPEPAAFHRYTDIERLQSHPYLLRPGEQVVVTEKLHGSNVRYGVVGGEFMVGSHAKRKAPNPDSIFWKPAIKHEVEAKLRAWQAVHAPGSDVLLHGEVVGVQDTRYGATSGSPGLRLFDLSVNGQYLDHQAAVVAIDEMGLPRVPVVHIGEFDYEFVVGQAEGQSTIADHVREGVVVKPLAERWDENVGRVILKAIGIGFRTRKGKQTDGH